MLDWYDLNARHAASLIWASLFVGFFLVKSPDVRRAFAGVVASALNRHLFPVFAGFFVVVGISTFCAVLLGGLASYWVTLPVVTAAVWTMGSGIALLVNYDSFVRQEEIFSRVVTRTLLPPAALTALVGASTLSLTFELILIPVVFVIGLLFIISNSDEKYRSVGSVCATLLFLYVVGMIALLIKDAVANIDNLKMASHAVILPVWLTIWVVPYLKLIILLEKVKFLLSAKRKNICKREYGDSWPLTVEKARLCCKFSAVWIEVQGRRYSLNGSAKTILPRYGLRVYELEEIWREDPAWEGIREALGGGDDLTPMRVNIGGLIAEGLALEEGR